MFCLNAQNVKKSPTNLCFLTMGFCQLMAPKPPQKPFAQKTAQKCKLLF